MQDAAAACASCSTGKSIISPSCAAAGGNRHAFRTASDTEVILAAIANGHGLPRASERHVRFCAVYGRRGNCSWRAIGGENAVLRSGAGRCLRFRAQGLMADPAFARRIDGKAGLLSGHGLRAGRTLHLQESRAAAAHALVFDLKPAGRGSGLWQLPQPDASARPAAQTKPGCCRTGRPARNAVRRQLSPMCRWNPAERRWTRA